MRLIDGVGKWNHLHGKCLNEFFFVTVFKRLFEKVIKHIFRVTPYWLLKKYNDNNHHWFSHILNRQLKFCRRPFSLPFIILHSIHTRKFHLVLRLYIWLQVFYENIKYVANVLLINNNIVNCADSQFPPSSKMKKRDNKIEHHVHYNFFDLYIYIK